MARTVALECCQCLLAFEQGDGIDDFCNTRKIESHNFLSKDAPFNLGKDDCYPNLKSNLEDKANSKGGGMMGSLLSFFHMKLGLLILM